MSQTVVVGLDDSQLAARALPFARTVARLWGGRMVLVHATAHQGGPSFTGLHDLAGALRGEGIDAEAVVRAPPPARAIVDIAGERNAALIVMASPPRRGLDRWLPASATEP